MAKYPVYLEIGGRQVVVIGAGSVASRKVETLCNAGAKVLVIAKDIQPEFTERCGNMAIETIRTKYSKKYLNGAVMVIAATNDNSLNSRIYQDCRSLDIICNVVDVPQLCDFYVPAVVKRGPLQIAIGTSGKSPAYSAKIRHQLENIFTEDHGHFLEVIGAVRQKVIAEVPDAGTRKNIFQALVTDKSFEYFVKNGADDWITYAENLIRNETAREKITDCCKITCPHLNEKTQS